MLAFKYVSFFREMEWRLDKEGREYHHFEDFCKLYRSEILNLNRMLDMLSKNGMLPGNLNLNFSVSNVSSMIIERLLLRKHQNTWELYCKSVSYLCPFIFLNLQSYYTSTYQWTSYQQWDNSLIKVRVNRNILLHT